MKDKKPYTFRKFCIMHNAFLSLTSLILFIKLASIVISSYKTSDLYSLICSEGIFNNIL